MWREAFRYVLAACGSIGYGQNITSINGLTGQAQTLTQFERTSDY